MSPTSDTPTVPVSLPAALDGPLAVSEQDQGKTENGQPQEPVLQQSESGPPTYNIVTVRDFFAVPSDRLAACLADFATFLQAAPHWAALLGHVSDEMHGAGRVQFTVGDSFRWVDDDDHNMSLTVLTPDGETTDALTITPSDAAAIVRSLDQLAATEAAAGSSVLAVDKAATPPTSRSTPEKATP